MSPVVVWARCRQGAAYLVGLVVMHPCYIGLALALIYGVTGSTVLVYIGVGILVLLGVSLCGSEAAATASTLAKKIRFSYRAWRVRRKWKRVMINAGVSKLDKTEVGQFRHSGEKLQTPRLLRKMTRTPMGLVATTDGRRTGLGIDSMGPKALTMCTGFGCRSLALRPDQDKPYLTQIRMLYDDPFKTVIHTHDLPPASDKSLVVIGLDEDGDPIEQGYALSELIAGNLGSGKSSALWRQMQAFVEHDIPWRCRMLDNKGGQEFSPLDGKAYYYAKSDFIGFLQDALNALAARQAILRARGMEKCPVNDPEFPLDVMIIDELITALATVGKNATVMWDNEKVDAKNGFMIYLTQIRAAGFIVKAAATAPQKELIGLIRDTFSYKTCLRVGSAEIVRIMFPVDDATKLYPAHQLPPIGTEGVGWVENKGIVTKFKGAFVTKPERAIIADGIHKWSKYYWQQTKHDKGRTNSDARVPTTTSA